MKTEVTMKRKLFGYEISQKSKTTFLSATDLVKAGNEWRMLNGFDNFNLPEWFRNKKTKEFVKALEEKYGKVKISGRGRGKHTWVHPFLFIDIALAISPKLKIETYEWLYDHLLKYRNDSGDSFKKMSGALYNKYGNKREFNKFIQKVSIKIQKACGINEWNDWQKADEKILSKRDKIHENIALLADILPLTEAVRIGILKGVDNEH
jgi:hypothetical protein